MKEGGRLQYSRGERTLAQTKPPAVWREGSRLSLFLLLYLAVIKSSLFLVRVDWSLFPWIMFLWFPYLRLLLQTCLAPPALCGEALSSHYRRLPILHATRICLQKYFHITVIYHFSFIPIFYFMCVSILATCMAVHMYARCPQKSEEGIRSPGTRVTDGCEPPCGCWKVNPGPLGSS